MTIPPPRTLRIAAAGLATVIVLAGTSLAVVLIRSPDQPAARWAIPVDASAAHPTDPAGPTAPADPATSPPPRDPPEPGAAAPQRSPEEAVEFVTWAILDTRTGELVGSDNLGETSTTASMIKAWLVADYLRHAVATGTEPDQDRLDTLRLILRDSSNPHADALYEELGQDASIARLLRTCELTDSAVAPGSWSNTRLSGRDTARMAACLADGRATGSADWTNWLLSEMRAVRGTGDFGIRHAFPAPERSAIAIKNGWVIRSTEDEWHVNCLAIGAGWTMGVLTRYPAERGYDQDGHRHGAAICQELADRHLRDG